MSTHRRPVHPNCISQLKGDCRMKPTKTYERAPVYSDLEVNETRVGIDWLTITANTAARKKMILLRFLKHEAALQLMGETRKNWKWRGETGGAIGGDAGGNPPNSTPPYCV